MFRNKKIPVILGITCAIGILIFASPLKSLFVENAIAQGSFSPNTKWTDIYMLLGFISTFLLGLSYKLIHFLEILVDPNSFIEIALLGDALQKIWKLSRDIVNVCLAVLLLAGAVIMIILPDKKDAMISMAPKFIMAMVLVNFSWFFPRVVLDISHILTATVYTIPAYVSKTSIECKRPPEKHGGSLRDCIVWKDVQFNVPSKSVEFLKNRPVPYKCENEGGGAICYQEVPLASLANTPGAIFLGLALNHANISSLTMFSDPSYTPINPNTVLGGANTSETESLFMLLMNTAFAFILMLALFLPLFAMAAAFILRIPLLWITIGFMPFIFIGFIIGDKIPESFNPKKIWNAFLSAAFLPFAVSIPLSAGFILLNAAVNIFHNATLLQGTVLGKLADEQNLPIQGVTSFLDLLWLFMTMAVFWIGSFTALKIGIFAKVTEPIRQWGQKLGGSLAKLPLSVPILPLPGAPSISAIAGVPQLIESTTRSRIADQQQTLINKSKEWFGDGSPVAAGMTLKEFENQYQARYATKTGDVHFRTSFDNRIINPVFTATHGTYRDTNFLNAIENKNTSNNQYKDFDGAMKEVINEIKALDPTGMVTAEKMKSVLEASGKNVAGMQGLEEAIEKWLNINPQ